MMRSAKTRGAGGDAMARREVIVMTQVSNNHPLMKAWKTWKAEEDGGANALRWAPTHPEGSLWAAFVAGFNAATQRAAALHESVNPASDQERHDGSPGAGAMGAVVEYRDAIRLTPMVTP